MIIIIINIVLITTSARGSEPALESWTVSAHIKMAKLGPKIVNELTPSIELKQILLIL